MGGVAKMPAGLCWLLLLGVVLAFGVAPSPAQASRNTHYDFVGGSRGLLRLNTYQDLLCGIQMVGLGATHNLVDPPYQNTVSVPAGGWAAMRFRTANPGVWFMHCHFHRHTMWGMDTVFIVRNGQTPKSQMMPRPPNMPKC